MDERQLIRRCQAGDQDAFADLYHRHARFAYGTALLITRDREAAAEAVQEAFIKVFRHLGQFDPDRPFRPWLYRILVHEAVSLCRRWSRFPPPVDPVAQDGPGPDTTEAAAVSRERAAAVWAAIQALPESFRITVILRYYTGLSEDEIATALGVQPGTVKSRLARARERLREPLAPFAPALPAQA